MLYLTDKIAKGLRTPVSLKRNAKFPLTAKVVILLRKNAKRLRTRAFGEGI